jgi:predicted RecA/RadA family phage recombinase
MAKNYLHEGWTITVPAPTGGVHCGDPILVGGFFGVANYDAEQTLPVEITLGGVWQLPKAATVTPAPGAVNRAERQRCRTAGAGCTAECHRAPRRVTRMHSSTAATRKSHKDRVAQGRADRRHLARGLPARRHPRNGRCRAEGLIALARTAEHPHTNWHYCSHYSKAIP